MSMKEWAEKEIEIACKHEIKGSEPDEWDYGVACYKSAYKAFKSLLEDGHSGYSIGVTKNILNRLIDGRPLTPIVDTGDIWTEVHMGKQNTTVIYQCSRMSSLFKEVYKDGTIKYIDHDRYYCVNKNNPDIGFTNSFVGRLINEMFPITMPYMPSAQKIKVICDDCLTNPKNGDFDTRAIYTAIMPDGERVFINRYFKESDNPNNPFEEITSQEYEERKKISDERMKENASTNR